MDGQDGHIIICLLRRPRQQLRNHPGCRLSHFCYVEAALQHSVE